MNKQNIGSKRRSLSLHYLVTILIILSVLSLQQFQVETTDETCPQPMIFRPLPDAVLDSRFKKYFDSPEFQSAALDRFSGSIKLETISYDFMAGNNPTIDPKFKENHAIFLEFHKYLASKYPKVHKELKLTIVGNYSLLYEWRGTKPDLKPVMLMAHFDVVPVDASTAKEWMYPPFSGEFHEGRIFGRGATDDKLALISIMESVESLLQMEFEPKRTLLLAFGHDEEISGYNGAYKIAQFLKNEYKIPSDGVEFILDEGPSIFNYGDTAKIAMVGTAEGGYMDLNITVLMNKGGHSSVPPPNTGIGILAKIITELEDNPFPLDLSKANPTFSRLQCEAKYTDELSAKEKFFLAHYDLMKNALLSSLSRDLTRKASLSTTQAVDVVKGGVKVNALPQLSYALVNYRINPSESVNSTAQRLTKLVVPIGAKYVLDIIVKIDYNLARPTETLHFSVNDPIGTIYLSFDGLEPSPTTDFASDVFQKFGGIIKHVFGNETIISPTRMQGNTDTRWSWNGLGDDYRLTPNVLRHCPFVVDSKHPETFEHTVNENAKLQSFISTIKFYHELIRGFSK